MGTGARERAKLADALLAAGPDAPTLCDGWTARDLAAHVVVRDRRPDAALGMFLPPFAGHLEGVTKGYLAEEFGALVDKVRGGTVVSPLIENTVNLMEFAVHTEDVRRGVEGWKPLPRDEALDGAISKRIGLMMKINLRKSPASIRLATHEGATFGPADATVTVTGDPLELLMFCFGRQGAATVEYSGPDADVHAVKVAQFGI